MSGTTAAALLERRYRRLLGAYPAEWRRRNEEAVLGVLLDAAEHRGRTAPGAREVIDLVAHGLIARGSDFADQEIPRRTAGVATGIGLAFSLVYCAVFVGPPGYGDWVPAAHVAPIAFLVSWIVVLVVILRNGAVPARALAAAVAALLPPVLLLTVRGSVDWSTVRIVTDWARPSSSTAAFLACVGLLALLGRAEPRLVLRSAAAAVVLFGIAFWLTSAWRDDYDQSLWGSPARVNGAVTGTLGALWGSAHGPMPPPTGLSTASILLDWMQGHLLLLQDLPVGAVLLALTASAVLALRRHRSSAAVVLLVTLPFVAALVVCASSGAVIWFQ